MVNKAILKNGKITEFRLGNISVPSYVTTISISRVENIGQKMYYLRGFA
jgi:hypothetical protein